MSQNERVYRWLLHETPLCKINWAGYDGASRLQGNKYDEHEGDTEDKWESNGEIISRTLEQSPMVTRCMLKDDMANTSEYNWWIWWNWHPLWELRTRPLCLSHSVLNLAKMFSSLPEQVHDIAGTAAPQQSIKSCHPNKPLHTQALKLACSRT